MSHALTITALRRLAQRFCSEEARWERLVADWGPGWGPAHEIGHVLLATPQERYQPSFGLCEISCTCDDARCIVVERAAMMISAKLCIAARRRDLVKHEINATDDYALINDPSYRRRAVRLLQRQGLARLPRTCEGLRQLLERRLGQPPIVA